MRAIFGADPIDSGKIYVHGKEVKITNSSHAIKAGIAFLTEDRKGQGLVLQESVKNKLILSNLKGFVSGIFLDNKKIEETSTKNMIQTRSRRASLVELHSWVEKERCLER